MPGDETKGYDIVMEFNEELYNPFFGETFDAGFLCGILDELRSRIPIIPNVGCPVFTLNVLFDRPTDISLPASASDTIDIRLALGESGSLGSMRIVAGVDVNSTTVAGVQLDIIRVNLASKIYHASANIGGLPVSGSIFTSVLQDIGSIPLLPVPVNRTSSEPTNIIRADTKVIDHTGAGDRDALAALLIMGGGAAGNRAAFTERFAELGTGEQAGMAFDFNWLCRIIRPRLTEALKRGDRRPVFDAPCRLHEPFRIDDEHDVDLTRLELTLVDGAIQISAAVRKSGFCYSATGTVGARILIRITDGNLQVSSEIDDPDIDVDIPWYCWIAAAVIGGLLGGILLGAIGTIIGAILVPLILWITTETVEGIVEDAAKQVTDAIGDLNFEVPAVGLNLILDEVFLDDIVLRSRVDIQSTAPIRAEGVITVRNGERFDLDNGTVGGETLPAADMIWDGERLSRRLRTLCDTALARTGSSAFSKFTRYKLYGLPYRSPASVPLDELAIVLPSFFNIFGIDQYQETKLVYGVRTNEDRYSVIQAIEVKDDYIRIRYRTYEKRLPRVDIIGGFRYEPVFPRPIDNVIDDIVGLQPIHTEDSKIPCPPVQAVPKDPCEAIKLGPKRLPKYFIPKVTTTKKVGKFQARSEALVHPTTVNWSIDKKSLEAKEGTLALGGVDVSYEVTNDALTLLPKSDRSFSFEIAVTVADSAATTISTSRCIEVAGSKPVKQRGTLSFAAFKNEYMNTFGNTTNLT